MKMKYKHYQFEYSLDYSGGDYDGVGDFAYVPVELADKIGEEEAFEKVTGINPIHIIFYTTDEVYDADGDLMEE